MCKKEREGGQPRSWTNGRSALSLFNPQCPSIILCCFSLLVLYIYHTHTVTLSIRVLWCERTDCKCKFLAVQKLSCNMKRLIVDDPTGGAETKIQANNQTFACLYQHTWKAQRLKVPLDRS